MSIITSLLDTDLYKFKMLYFLWKMDLADTYVSYKLTNRSTIDLRQFISEGVLRQEIDSLAGLTLRYDELRYLVTIFDEEFVQWLSTLHMGFDMMSENINNIIYSGPISNIILYEVPIMAIINELFGHRVLEGMGRYSNKHEECFIFNLCKKLNEIKKFTDSGIKLKFVEFGTRRRSSKRLQDIALNECIKWVPNSLIGTSNVLLAKKYALTPCGTCAHEMNMLYAALALNETTCKSVNLQCSQITFVQEWMKIFPETYYLTDTYGTEWFLRNCPKDIFGVRQDSGSPDTFMTRLADTRFENIPVMFSDGLDVTEMIHLSKKYQDKTISFGWGTNLTNDGLVEPLKIVIKLHSVQVENKEIYTVKLSDNPGKAIGRPEDITLYKGVFGYPEDEKTKEINY